MADDKLMNVDIVTPQKTIFSGQAVSVSVPGGQSPFQILYNHAPIVSTLEKGVVKIVDAANKTTLFTTTDGFIEVRKNNISILVETAEAQ